MVFEDAVVDVGLLVDVFVVLFFLVTTRFEDLQFEKQIAKMISRIIFFIDRK